MANYKDAKPETKLAFMIGYLSGAGASSRMRSRGPSAFTKWSLARHKEVDSLCAEFDETLLRQVASSILLSEHTKAARKN